jgi:hypothetical protein
MVQTDIDISILDNHLQRRTFTYAKKPQHTHTYVVVVRYTTTTENGGNDTSVRVRYTTVLYT